MGLREMHFKGLSQTSSLYSDIQLNDQYSKYYPHKAKQVRNPVEQINKPIVPLSSNYVSFANFVVCQSKVLKSISGETFKLSPPLYVAA